jgi:hypothetical protein
MLALTCRANRQGDCDIIDYLIAHFLAEEVSRININKAAPIDLESGLTLRRSQADIWSSLSKDGGKTFNSAVRVRHAVSPGMIPGRNSSGFGDDLQNLAVDDQNAYMVWTDSRSGFQAVWFGRVPLSAY